MRTDRLFPLYLAPLERFFLADVGPEHPMTFTIRLDLTGVVRREAFERAIAAALKRHPLLHAYVRKAKRNRPCWVHAGDGKPSIDWRSAEDPVICENGEHICLDRETGLRVWVRQASETAIVVLQFHHACTDGIGAYRFIGDLLASYGLEVGGTEPLPRLEPVEPAQLRERFAVQVELWASNDRWGQLRRGLGQLWRLIRNRPRRLPPRDSSAATAASFPGFFTRSLEADEHEALRQAAQQIGATLNDLLLAVLFQTLRAWTFTDRRPSARDHLRIIMPTDLRSSEHYLTPAACLTSCTFLSRAARDCEDWNQVLPNVLAQTQAIRNDRAGLCFSDTVAMGFHVPGLMPLILKGPLCLATAVMSNIGDPTRRFTAVLPRRAGRILAGNLTLDDVTGVPPLRRNTLAAFSAFAYRRRLTICLRCQAPTFSPADTEQLLDLYVNHLRAAAAQTKTKVSLGETA